ncbi:MAG TPA: ABC transporter permease, partial [Firmicutes bacterium]|nr:ABC transporter permease [Bacillota bacterium]
LTYVLLFFLYMAIVLYGSGVSMTVVNEKTSRVIELLVSAARPTEIMAGKLLASPRCLPGK